jgi:hypothetical protein
MPKFLLILRGDVTVDYSTLTPADFAKILGDYEAWSQRLTQSGHLEGGEKLTDQGGKVIWPRGKKVEVKDGPYVESKEVVGGYYLVRADS